jgi:hypothetical protein
MRLIWCLEIKQILKGADANQRNHPRSSVMDSEVHVTSGVCLVGTHPKVLTDACDSILMRTELRHGWDERCAVSLAEIDMVFFVFRRCKSQIVPRGSDSTSAGGLRCAGRTRRARGFRPSGFRKNEVGYGIAGNDG